MTAYRFCHVMLNEQKLAPPFREKIKKLNDSRFRAAIASESLYWRKIVHGTIRSMIIIVIDIVINNHRIGLRHKIFDFSQFQYSSDILRRILFYDMTIYSAPYSLIAFPRAFAANCVVHL